MFDIVLNPRFVGILGMVLGCATPLAGVATLAIWRERRADLVRQPLYWLIAGAGPLVALLWRVFNAIESAFGLDSVPALLINVALFALLGMGISALVRFGSPPFPPR